MPLRMKGGGRMLRRFSFGGMTFEYDEDKDRRNRKKHGIPFRYAARVFFDDERIELFDDEHSADEERYDTIGSASAGTLNVIGSLKSDTGEWDDILFVAYTERSADGEDGRRVDVARLISARLATSFERGLYYGKHS